MKDLPGPPPENPVGELLRLISDYKSRAAKFIEGTEQADSLRIACKEEHQLFKKRLSSTVPMFFPWTSDTVHSNEGASYDTQVLEFDDSDSYVPASPDQTGQLQMDLTTMREHVNR